MTTSPAPSSLRFAKHRARARIELTSGAPREGCFFVAGGAARHDGPERVFDLLESAGGFVPFETLDGETRLVNPLHLVSIVLEEDEASRDPGYVIGRRRTIVLRLSTGREIAGAIRVTRPEGYDRLSDWTRQPDRFRYIESPDGLLLVNTVHIIEVTEVVEVTAP